MKKIKVLIGANFGDEGKGLMTDYFCSQVPPEKSGGILNVRFCGGAQAGHTVVSPGGLRHVFSHFGAGTFNKNVATYLGRDFVANPILFWREYGELARFGIRPKVYIHPGCMVTLPFDMMVNQMIERHRADKRHGSCGLGINETLVRNSSLKIANVISNAAVNTYLDDFMDTVRSEYSFSRLKELGAGQMSALDAELFYNQTIQKNYIAQFNDMLGYCEIVGDEILDRYENIVFEGAQGLLLDKNNLSFFPNLTPSNTGLNNVLLMLYQLGPHWDRFNDIEICYVTRSYFTRHGAGFFPSECKKEAIAEGFVYTIDKTNHYNEFQGDFRYGYFDRELFLKTVKKDLAKAKGRKAKVSLAVTHLDETSGLVAQGTTTRLGPEELSGEAGIFESVYGSYGPTRDAVKQGAT